jgi:hypothetical protein
MMAVPDDLPDHPQFDRRRGIDPRLSEYGPIATLLVVLQLTRCLWRKSATISDEFSLCRFDSIG